MLRCAPGEWRPPALTLGLVHRRSLCVSSRGRQNERYASLGLPGEPRREQRVTLDLDPGLGVTQGPDVHHHVHAAGGEVLVVW